MSEELERAIETFVVNRNRNPKPFVWTAAVQKITAKIQRLIRGETTHGTADRAHA
jgi:hypothetical protein